MEMQILQHNNYFDLRKIEGGRMGAVSKLVWNGLSALDLFCHFIPRASP
jgi:hypothetical protein